MQQWALIIRIVYALCLAGATINHVRAIFAHGWLPDQLPLATAIYWGSLTFLDPIAALMLFWRPRVGVAMTVVIIVSDVAHNLWFIADHQQGRPFFQDATSSGFMMSQIAFLIFVAATAWAAWPHAKTVNADNPS